MAHRNGTYSRRSPLHVRENTDEDRDIYPFLVAGIEHGAPSGQYIERDEESGHSEFIDNLETSSTPAKGHKSKNSVYLNRPIVKDVHPLELCCESGGGSTRTHYETDDINAQFYGDLRKANYDAKVQSRTQRSLILRTENDVFSSSADALRMDNVGMHGHGNFNGRWAAGRGSGSSNKLSHGHWSHLTVVPSDASQDSQMSASTSGCLLQLGSYPNSFDQIDDMEQGAAALSEGESSPLMREVLQQENRDRRNRLQWRSAQPPSTLQSYESVAISNPPVYPAPISGFPSASSAAGKHKVSGDSKTTGDHDDCIDGNDDDKDASEGVGAVGETKKGPQRSWNRAGETVYPELSLKPTSGTGKINSKNDHILPEMHRENDVYPPFVLEDANYGNACGPSQVHINRAVTREDSPHSNIGVHSCNGVRGRGGRGERSGSSRKSKAFSVRALPFYSSGGKSTNRGEMGYDPFANAQPPEFATSESIRLKARAEADRKPQISVEGGRLVQSDFKRSGDDVTCDREYKEIHSEYSLPPAGREKAREILIGGSEGKTSELGRGGELTLRTRSLQVLSAADNQRTSLGRRGVVPSTAASAGAADPNSSRGRAGLSGAAGEGRGAGAGVGSMSQRANPVSANGTTAAAAATAAASSATSVRWRAGQQQRSNATVIGDRERDRDRDRDRDGGLGGHMEIFEGHLLHATSAVSSEAKHKLF